MADGGRSAAKGFLYQYVRTLDALIEAAHDDGVAALHIEGRRPDANGPTAESVDYELTDHTGSTLIAAQVKSRQAGRTLSAAEVFRVLIKLVHDREAVGYQLVTNAALSEPATALVEVLTQTAGINEVRRRVGQVLSSAGGERARSRLDRLPDRELSRLQRAEVIIDQREDAEVHACLKARLRGYRNEHRRGLGDESAGLMAGYLISEIFASAADEFRSEITIEEFKPKLLVDGATLRAALGRSDWGVVIGPVPDWPDVYRGELVDRMASFLSAGTANTGIPRCVLAGLSGIGKSSLAATYVFDRADLYDVIYWIDAENEETLVTSFARVLAHQGDRVPAASGDYALVRSRVHDSLAQMAGRWLMVFDNCTHLRALEPWIPGAGDGHVLVTSTDSTVPTKGGGKLEIGPMTSVEAVTLLRKRMNLQEESIGRDLPAVTHLADAMECWPLALELAAAYLTAGGVGVAGIPNYLDTLKMRSLDHSRSVPPGYPRTLVEAIYLCLARIESQSQRDNDPAGVATSAVWFAAYLSCRRIPAHLLVSSVWTDPEEAGGFSHIAPSYVSATVCPTPEVVSVLRSQSLVALDEPLPATGLIDPAVPTTTISVNSVLQEVLRHHRDADPRLPQILGRLAYHIGAWLAVAHEQADYPRTLAFAAHAAAIDQNAARLEVSNDYIWFLRGNLAGVLQRRGDTDRAAMLLRAEIAALATRTNQHCIVLRCLAQIMLAGVLANDEPPSVTEILSNLGNAFTVLQALAPAAPARVAQLALSLRGVLRDLMRSSWDLGEHSVGALLELDSVVSDLLSRLPDSMMATAVASLERAETALLDGMYDTAVTLSRMALSQASSENHEMASFQQLQRHAQRLIIEALIEAGDFARAASEFTVYLSMTESAELHAAAREQLLHNAGKSLALTWLTSDEPTPEMASLLMRLTAPDVTDAIEAAFPGRTAARIRLLRAVSALANDNEQRAAAHLEMARPVLRPDSDSPNRDIAWALLGQLTEAALQRPRT